MYEQQHWLLECHGCISSPPNCCMQKLATISEKGNADAYYVIYYALARKATCIVLLQMYNMCDTNTPTAKFSQHLEMTHTTFNPEGAGSIHQV